VNGFAIIAVIQRTVLNVSLLIELALLIVPSSLLTRDPAQKIVLNEAVMIGLAALQSLEHRLVDVTSIKNPLLDLSNGFFD
jgi:hypothetical protein